jgi:hypothetical protein
VADHNGQQEHQSGHEHTREALEHSEGAHRQTQAAAAGHGIATFSHADIAKRAHELWEARGCPEGTADQDWFDAAQELRSRAHTA